MLIPHFDTGNLRHDVDAVKKKASRRGGRLSG
jgi:hypothetical protein